MRQSRGSESAEAHAAAGGRRWQVPNVWLASPRSVGQPPRGSHPGQRWAPCRTGEGCVLPEPGPPRASGSLWGQGMKPAASQKPQGSCPAEAGCRSCDCFLSLASVTVTLRARGKGRRLTPIRSLSGRMAELLLRQAWRPGDR